MGRANQGSWRPGQSGNPQGRPRVGSGLAQYVRAKTKSGRELVDHALRVLRGEARTKKVELYQGEPVELDVYPSLADQAAARQWLSERGFGRVADGKELPQEPEPKREAGPPAQVIDIRPPEVT